MSDALTKSDLPFLVEAMDEKLARLRPLTMVAEAAPTSAADGDKVAGNMSIPEPVTVDQQGTMSADDYRACSLIMTVCQNMVQKSLTDAARTAGIDPTVALTNMNAWVQAYVDFPMPFFNFKDKQSDTKKTTNFSLTADPDFVETVVNIKNVSGLKDAVVGALRKSAGTLASYAGSDQKFNYFGVITAYNANEISARLIKFEMNMKQTNVNALCGGTNGTTLDTAYDTYQFVADKDLMIKLQAKMGDKLLDVFADSLLEFAKEFYEDQLTNFKANIASILKAPASG